MRQPLTILLPDGWTGEIVDLSATGFRVRTVAIIPRNTDLEGTVVLPSGERIAIRGKIVWSTPPDHLRRVPGEVGVQLGEVPEKYFSTLVRLFADQP